VSASFVDVRFNLRIFRLLHAELSTKCWFLAVPASVIHKQNAIDLGVSRDDLHDSKTIYVARAKWVPANHPKYIVHGPGLI